MRALLLVCLIASAAAVNAPASAQIVRCEDRVYRVASECPGARKPGTVTNLGSPTAPPSPSAVPQYPQYPLGSAANAYGAIMNMKRGAAISAQQQADLRRDAAISAQERAKSRQ